MVLGLGLAKAIEETVQERGQVEIYSVLEREELQSQQGLVFLQYLHRLAFGGARLELQLERFFLVVEELVYSAHVFLYLI